MVSKKKWKGTGVLTAHTKKKYRGEPVGAEGDDNGRAETGLATVLIFCVGKNRPEQELPYVGKKGSVRWEKSDKRDEKKRKVAVK